MILKFLFAAVVSFASVSAYAEEPTLYADIQALVEYARSHGGTFTVPGDSDVQVNLEHIDKQEWLQISGVQLFFRSSTQQFPGCTAAYKIELKEDVHSLGIGLNCSGDSLRIAPFQKYQELAVVFIPTILEGLIKWVEKNDGTKI